MKLLGFIFIPKRDCWQWGKFWESVRGVLVIYLSVWDYEQNSMCTANSFWVRWHYGVGLKCDTLRFLLIKGALAFVVWPKPRGSLEKIGFLCLVTKIQNGWGPWGPPSETCWFVIGSTYERPMIWKVADVQPCV